MANKPETPPQKRLVLISGVSGSGKSTALKALRDIGFFCVDNLPTSMLGSFADFLIKQDAPVPPIVNPKQKFALLLSSVGVDDFGAVSLAIDKLKEAKVEVIVFFFDCQDDVIVRRFRETRRPHPLQLNERCNDTILEAVQNERDLLGSFRSIATRVFDTSSYSPHDLRRAMEDVLEYSNTLKLVVQSFGFKYGVPHDADLVVDVRFLPNPHFDPGLRPSTGHEDAVKQFVLENQLAKDFLEKYESLLRFLIPLYEAEGKRYLTVAIGCTGGRHRSVAISRELIRRLSDTDLTIIPRDRDLERTP